MQTYKAPVRDIRFCLETMGYDQVAALNDFGDYDLDTLMSLVEEAGNPAPTMLPVNSSGDQEGVTYNPETMEVTTPKGFKELWAKFRENEFAAMPHPVEYGGHGAPLTFAFIMSELSTATNKSFSMCPGLTQGLVDALLHHGSDEQKKTYLGPYHRIYRDDVSYRASMRH